MPGWLAQVITGLVKSDHIEAERRLTPAQAMALLQVEGVARAWEAGQAVDAERRQRQEVEAVNAQMHAEAEPLRQSVRRAEAAASRPFSSRAPLPPASWGVGSRGGGPGTRPAPGANAQLAGVFTLQAGEHQLDVFGLLC